MRGGKGLSREAHRAPVFGHHPLIYGFDRLQRVKGYSDRRLSKEAGITHTLIRNWRLGRTPNIANFDAALNALGYKLAIVEIDR